jgi:hypothetical protein
MTKIGELGTTLAVTSNRNTLITYQCVCLGNRLTNGVEVISLMLLLHSTPGNMFVLRYSFHLEAE